MTMLEIFKSRLPEGLEIVETKKRGKYNVCLNYDGTEAIVTLPTTCVPTKENFMCDIIICTSMMRIASSRGDEEMFGKWCNKQDELFKANGGI